MHRILTYPVLSLIMAVYAVAENKRRVLNFFYRVRGIPHGIMRCGIRIAFYDGLVITFPYVEDPAFDDVWLRQVYYAYVPRRKDVVIDVGAHMGFFALKIVRSVKKIVAVEPDPSNFKFLSYNVHLNNFSHEIVTRNIALGEKNGKIFLDRSGYGYGRSKSTTRKTDFQLEMQTLDNLVREEKLDEVGLIKIDTEGFELDILKGSIRTLEQCKPNLIVATYHFPMESQLVAEFLKKHDYAVSFYRMPLFLFGGSELYLYAKANDANRNIAS